MNVLYAGMVVWLVTWILVESELFRPLREFAAGCRDKCVDRGASTVVAGGVCLEWRRAPRHPKLAYLANCHMCSGTYVALGVALVVPGPLPAWWLNALLFKVVAHGVLEVMTAARRFNA